MAKGSHVTWGRVVDACVAADVHRGLGLGDDDGHVAALVLVVAVSLEDPVRRPARDVLEPGAQVQRAGTFAADAGHEADRAGGALAALGTYAHRRNGT